MINIIIMTSLSRRVDAPGREHLAPPLEALPQGFPLYLPVTQPLPANKLLPTLLPVLSGARQTELRRFLSTWLLHMLVYACPHRQ